MSNQYEGGFISKTPPTTTGGKTGAASGVWTIDQQMRIQQAGNWPIPKTVPGAPTIGTATAGTNNDATITFTAPADNGGSTITGYTATSSPGSITGTAASSPISVTGLTSGQSYTFTVTATNAIGTGPASAASNSITATSAPVFSYVTTTGSSSTGSTSVDMGTVSLGSTAGDRYTIICVGAIANSAFSATIGGISATSIVQVKYSGDDSYVGILICDTSSLGTSANITISNSTYINRPGVSVYRVTNLSSASAYSTSTDNSGTALSCSASAPAASIGVGIFFNKDALPGDISFTNFTTSANDGSWNSGSGSRYKVGSGTIDSAATVTMAATATQANACAAMAIFT